MFVRRIARTSEGLVALRFPPHERELLRSLPAELHELLAAAPGDPDLRRLFPPGYAEEAEEREYRRLVGDSLLEGKRRALETVARTAEHETLTLPEAEAWLTALNDLRLVLGTRLDVSEEALLDDVSPEDPRAPQLGLYAYLSWLQEQLVAALAPGLDVPPA